MPFKDNDVWNDSPATAIFFFSQPCQNSLYDTIIG